MATQGQLTISKHQVNCWDCGDAIAVGDEVFQGNDDHNYCVDYCADLTNAEIADNYSEWAAFNGATR